jgi:hypothetical protein
MTVDRVCLRGAGGRVGARDKGRVAKKADAVDGHRGDGRIVDGLDERLRRRRDRIREGRREDVHRALTLSAFDRGSESSRWDAETSLVARRVGEDGVAVPAGEGVVPDPVESALAGRRRKIGGIGDAVSRQKPTDRLLGNDSAATASERGRGPLEDGHVVARAVECDPGEQSPHRPTGDRDIERVGGLGGAIRWHGEESEPGGRTACAPGDSPATNRRIVSPKMVATRSWYSLVTTTA